ncbi:aldose 1-epimerase family protein [Pseudarthrobacter sp. J75]|uniref:aldose 1-epimerase family protein n=1 Tax=unclassified Pseudarthrobacter TaxID=2647000 RepID=UPI002E80ECBB|nr:MULTISPECIES: aldose 1-epimerase family protein [unclassified Pseudarthrobacter]MEE2521605.1 aldose 1-epimerase family protein [Pseudarthrobacter sp. J47]MEE2527682.1 aldose 1-epimerase family protein [Pseudarthrobacter sp. J75]
MSPETPARPSDSTVSSTAGSGVDSPVETPSSPSDPPSGPASAPASRPGNRPATGRQYVLERGNAKAVVTELAAGLRLYSVDGVPFTETYDDDQIPPGATGITLAPWANRVEDGLWYLDGRKQQLDITEVPRNNAIHGLLRNTAYAALDQQAHSVSLEATIFPQHGYPFLVRHQVEYSLAAEGGLVVRQTLINDSAKRAPFVLGAHPYLRVGDVPVADLVLTVQAETTLTADGRLIPRGEEPVRGDHDFRSGRRIRAIRLDAAFTGLTHDGGVARHTLTADDGRSVSLWQDQNCPYVHVFISTEYPGRELVVAIEPMTGPANAFNSGDGLSWLEPGAEFAMTWGIDAVSQREQAAQG